jgi:glycosyl transferase family 1
MSFSERTKARMQSADTLKECQKPRICMPSGRNFKKKTFLCGHYEAQDVLCEIDQVDLVCLDALPGYEFKESWQRRLLYRDFSRKLIYQGPGLRKVQLKQEYDLFLALCQTHHDFLHIGAIRGWKDHCKTSVCWIDEMWASEVPRYKYWIHALKQFDHVFVGCKGTVDSLANAIGKPVHWLSGGVDALRFSPHPNPPARVVDVYSIGRRWEGIHRSLLRMAKDRPIFYIHDTFGGSLSDVYDYRQHRDLFSNVAKRCRYFVVAPGKVDSSDETRGQVEIGHRYYEGAAAGAVMIGQAPKCEAFDQMFPWPEAVIHVEPDGSDVAEVISRLNSSPDRSLAISQRNAAEALLRHDWVYRWKQVFEVAGIDPMPAMTAREQRLRQLAAVVLSPFESKSAARSLR